MTEDPALTVDMRGHRCPAPVIALARQITTLEAGQVIAVLADDPAARLDIPAWCRMRGHAFVEERRLGDDAGAAYLVRRS